MKDEFAGLVARTYSYLIDDGIEDKKVIQRKLKFEN